MDCQDNDCQVGPLDVWQTFNSSTIVLFKNLEQAADGLETLMTYILNIKREFSDFLVQRATAPENVKKQCFAFNKWLLGRLFCVLSVKKLSRIHKLSASTQLKILSILSTNAAPFLNEVLSEYITCLRLIRTYYEGNTDKTNDVLILNVFIPDKLDIPFSVLDLSPMPVEVQDMGVCQDLIVFLMDILCQTVLTAGDFHLFKANNNLFMEEALYILENMDMRLKNCAITFFSKIINEFGINSNSKHTDKFLSVIEKLIYTMPLLSDKGSIQQYKFLNSLNGHLSQLFGIIYYHGVNISDYKKAIVLNLCNFILEIKEVNKMEIEYDQCQKNIFSLELKESSKQLLEKFITEEEVASLESSVFDNYIKVIPSVFSTKLLADAKLYSNQFPNFNSIDMMEISRTFQNILSSLLLALKSSSDENKNVFVISAHLNKALNLFNILYNFQVNFHNWCQIKNGFLQDLSNENLKNSNQSNIYLKLFTSESTHQIVNELKYVIEKNLHKSSQPTHEFNVITNILTKLLCVGNEMNIADVELTLQLISLPNISTESGNNSWLVQTQQKIDFGFDKNYHKISYFKTLLIQNLCLNDKMYATKWRDAISILKSELDMENITIHLEVLRCLPLLLLNSILTLEELVTEYLYVAFISKNADILQELVQILPSIVCIASGHFIISQSTVDNKNNVGIKLNSTHGLNVNVICKHCYKMDLLTSKENVIKYKSIERQTFIMAKDDFLIFPDATVASIKRLFTDFLNIKMYIGVPDSDIGNLIITFARHSILVPSSIEVFLCKGTLNDLVNILKPLTTNVLQDNNIDDSLKSLILASIIRHILSSSKKCLETNDSRQQELCLECIRQFGMTRSTDVVLPSIKLLICFLMYSNCVYGAKAALYIRDICEAQKTTPNKVYFRYKKDFCRVMMEHAAHNFLLGQSCSSSIEKVVKVFGYVGYRDWLSKDTHHALPYLIPIIMKTDKLKPIITEMASLIHCTPGEFLSKRFPHIYPHIYIYESVDIADKCFQYLQEVTGSSVIELIKKHFRVVLTEFLLQYCCGPEKVLKACRWLASIDPEYSPMPSDTNLPLTQVADFIQPRFLGVLACFDTKLVNTKGAISVKRKALQSFPDILNLMGARHMTPLRFKILAILRSALALMEEFPKLNALAWNAFIHNIDTVALGPLLITIFVSLLPLVQFAIKEINEIFEYLIVSNENLLCSHIPDLFFLEGDNISLKVKQIVTKHVSRIQPQNFIDKLKWYLKYLNQDASEIRVYTLKFLTNLMKNRQAEMSEAIFGNKDINPVVVELIDILIAGCRDKDTHISEWSGRCLGELGALEPSLLPRHQTALQSSGAFAFSVRDTGFIRLALNELTRAFQCEKDTKNMDSYALAIQEILKAFDISPGGENKELWDSFPDHMHQIMLPLLSSRYNLAFPLNPKRPNRVHRVYGTASTFNEWAFNWASQLIPLIDVRPIQDVLRMVQPSLKRDLRTLVLFLPYILLHTIISNDDNTFITDEMLAVIGPESFNNEAVHAADIPKNRTSMTLNLTPAITPLVLEEGTQLKCRKMVYVLLDFFNRWLLEWTHAKKNVFTDKNYVKIKKFLEGFCKLTIAKGNFLCGELERALQYLEMYVEGSPDRLQEQLAFLAEIYVVLDEPDCVAGIMRMKQSEPSLSELILAHKVTGQLQDAATCYEKCAQQGDIDDERLQGMVEVYLGLDQPYTALRLLQGAHSNNSVEGALAAEPFWRLAMFNDLEKLLEQPNVSNDDRWGVRVGHCLLALRGGLRAPLEDRLAVARCALLRRLGEGASTMSELRRGYTHAYNCALGLHMLAEIEHSENAIYKIKELIDGDTACGEIIDDLIQEWNLRLRLVQSSARTVEPVLRLRRILLEQSKELLESSHPQTASLLDSHIGKIWLQSAKFARKACIFQQAYIYILNGDKYSPKELFIEKAKLYWMRGQQEPAFYTLKRGLEEHFPSLTQLSPADRKLCAKAKLLKAIYNDETTNVDMDVNITHYKEAVEVYRQWEKSLVCLAAYYERVYAAMAPEEKNGASGGAARARALDCYGRALQHGHTKLYQSMPRMLSIWLDFEVTEPKSPSMVTLIQICSIIDTFTERLPLYLFLSAFSQIISRICHPIKEVYAQLKSIIIKLILKYPQHSLWMMMCVIKSSYPQRIKRCQEILNDPLLKEPGMLKFIYDFNQLAEKLIELCNKPIADNIQSTYVSTLVRSLPRLLTSDNFSQIMMPHEQFVKIVLPFHSVKKEKDTNFNPFPHMVYITGIEDPVTVFPSLQRPRKVTFKGSDGKSYMMMLKPKDDLRKDFRLMEFNGVVNRYLQDNAESRERRLYIRTYGVLPLNEECGIIQWVPNLLGFRPILMNLYKEKGIYTSARELKELMCANKDPLAKKRKVFEEQLFPKHPPVFGDWFRYTFPDPHTWYQARSAYIRTTAVMSMVGYILGLGDRHGENILFDSTNGDTVHVDFNCLFNRGEAFEWPERVPFRLTHNMQHAMGPLACEGTYRKCCEVTLRVLRSQTATLMSVIRPFVYDPLVAWQRAVARDTSSAERTNQSAKDHLAHIEQRLQGMVRTKDKQFSLSLSPEGQANNLILEATSIVNLCQMYIGWGPFL